MSALRVVTVVWFAVSVIVAVFGNAAFYVWLVRKGARPRFALAGVPGHLDGVYLAWCEAHNRSPRRLLLLRRLSYANLLLAVVPAILGFPG